MSIVEFLNDLQQRGIIVWVEADQLRYRAPKEAFTSEVRAELFARKAEVIQFLEEVFHATTSALPPITPVDRSGILPLSFSQERLWTLDRMQTQHSAYAIHATLRLQGVLNTVALRQTIHEIVERHEILRTVFPVQEGRPVQMILPTASVSLQEHNLEHHLADQQEEVLQRHTTVHLQPFDLARGPLLRISLLRWRPAEHLLLLTLHHILADGWSIGILLKELTTIYEMMCSGGEITLPRPAIQYADFTQWQRVNSQGKAFEALRSYWRTKLEGLQENSEIRPDFPRSATRTFRGQQLPLTLSSTLSQGLRDFAQREGVTLFVHLLTALKVLLLRHTGVGDCAVGAPVAGRLHADLEEAIGCFVNTLVFRTELNTELTYRAALTRVRQTALDAYTHQELPFEQLLADLRIERNLSRTPFFQVLLNMLPFHREPMEAAGLKISFLAPPEEEAKFDLTFYIEDAEQIQLTLHYNADLFHEEHMRDLLAQYAQLLEQTIANPAVALSSFSLLTSGMRSQLPDPHQKLQAIWEGAVQELFAQQAERTPDEPAFHEAAYQWSYRELEQRANQLAHALRTRGIQTGEVVAIHAQRSGLLVWAILGILKAGAAFCIFDSSEPTERLLACLEQLQLHGWIELAVSSEPDPVLNAWLAEARLAYRVTLSYEEVEDFAQYPASAPELTFQSEMLAYVAFTSGSTGQPRGVLGGHGPLAHFVRWQQRTFGLRVQDRFSLLSGPGHDPLLRDIFTPLTLGAMLLIPDAHRFEPDTLCRWLVEEQVTVSHLTPSLLRFLTSGKAVRGGGHWPLRYLFLGGEQLKWDDVVSARQVAPGVTCVNFYGLTETPQAVSCYVVLPEQPELVTVPVGKGIEGVQLLLLNQAGQRAGLGEIGEIYVRSPYLSQGYLGCEELTRQRFIANSSGDDLQDQMYCTGDLGLYRHDGAVLYAGRADRQIKVRGFRIEPGEIEYYLIRHPAVHEAYVVSRQHSGYDRLVAYVVLHDPEIVDSDLRQHLRLYLLNQMVPDVFMRLSQLPLNANGKVDERQLPDVVQIQRAQLTNNYEVPRTPTEIEVARIWADALGLAQVGRNDSFFEIGGNSLIATLLLQQMEDRFGAALPMRALFEEPTISCIARLVDEMRSYGQKEQRQAIRPLKRGAGQVEDLLSKLQSIVEAPGESRK